MTFRELMQIEQYIFEIESLKNLSLDGNQLQIKANILNEKIASCVQQYNADNINWDKGLLFQNDGHYDPRRIKDTLEIMQAALQGILNRLPYYDDICDLRKDISYGYNINSNAKRKMDFIVEKIKKYSSNIQFEQSVLTAREKILIGNRLNEDQIDSVFYAVLVDLENYRNSLCTEKRDLKEIINSPVLVKVEQNQNNTQTQYSSIDIKLSIENCLKDLEDCESVTEEEIAELKNQIDEIQKLLENKRGNKKSIREKIKDVLKWVVEKGTDVMIAVLPTVITILNNIK